jgi:monofunctional biosynthetic peptidoglycan transglycosylase
MNEELAAPKKSERIKKYLKMFLTIILGFFILSVSSVIIYRFVPVPYTPLMFWKSASSIFQKETIGIEKKWVPIKNISMQMQRAVIRAEDAKFYIHHGFDIEAIEAAIKYNKTHKKQKGASTISQQTAKNVFLWPSRSWIRKGMEVYFTVLIEALWSKERIIEVYLNVIELGPGVYGVEAASQKYFHKKAKNLTGREASLMAAVLPNPIKFKINHPSAYILRRQRKIMGGGAIVTVATAPEIKPETKSQDSKDFFDIKFDEDEDKDLNTGADSNDSAPDN